MTLNSSRREWRKILISVSLATTASGAPLKLVCLNIAGKFALNGGVQKKRAKGKTFVQSLFEGTMTNEIKCLTCETASLREGSGMIVLITDDVNRSRRETKHSWIYRSISNKTRLSAPV